MYEDDRNDNADEIISLVENVASYRLPAADKVEDEHQNEVSEKDEVTVQSKDDTKIKTRIVYYAFELTPMR